MLNTKQDFQLKPNAGFHTKYIEMAARLKAAGCSIEDIGVIFGFSESTIKAWARSYPAFKKAIDEGRKLAGKYVLAQAFRAACGYDYEEWNEKFDKEGNSLGKSVFHKHAEPNPKLIMWLMCNLSPEEWKSEHKITVQNDQNINVKLDGKIASEQIMRLAGKLVEDQPKRKLIDATVTDGNTGTIPTDDTEGIEA